MKIKAISIPDFDHSILKRRISLCPTTSCMNWNGHIRSDGYGVIWIKGIEYKTHRVAYHIYKGILSATNVIDHICKNKKCCNPDHLREVTQRINATENSLSPPSFNKKKTHCIRGHEFTPDNIYSNETGVYGGVWRKCLICKKEAARIWYLKNKGRR